MANKSCTQSSLDWLEDRGWLACVVERRVGPITKDLYGCIDILALRGSETLAVQVTSGGNVSARLIKVRASDSLPWMLQAGWRIEVHGWRTLAQTGWTLRRVSVEA